MYVLCWLKLNSLVRDGKANPKPVADDVEVAVARVKALEILFRLLVDGEYHLFAIL